MDAITIQLNDFDDTEDEGFIQVDGKGVNARTLGILLSEQLNAIFKQLPRSASIVFAIRVFDNKEDATGFLTSLEIGQKTGQD